MELYVYVGLGFSGNLYVSVVPKDHSTFGYLIGHFASWEVTCER